MSDDFDIPGLVEAPPADAPAGPFEGRSAGDVLAIDLADGQRLEGSLLLVAGMRYLHVRDGSLNGRVEGPFAAGDVASLTVVQGAGEVRAERQARRLGEPVPGTLRRTRDGYQARLDALARVAAATPDFLRRCQVEAQFEAVADEIALAKTKRNWLLAAARWARHSNAEPTKLDLSGGDMTMAERFQRPRDQDFDPDPAVRRRRRKLPPHLADDPRSTHNMLRALRREGFKARVSVVGELTDDRADLLVDFPDGREHGRYMVVGARGPDGAMAWRHRWAGNASRADERRRIRSARRPDYARLTGTIASGLAPGQPDPDPGLDPTGEPDAAAPRA